MLQDDELAHLVSWCSSLGLLLPPVSVYPWEGRGTGIESQMRARCRNCNHGNTAFSPPYQLKVWQTCLKDCDASPDVRGEQYGCKDASNPIHLLNHCQDVTYQWSKPTAAQRTFTAPWTPSFGYRIQPNGLCCEAWPFSRSQYESELLGLTDVSNKICD